MFAILGPPPTQPNTFATMPPPHHHRPTISSPLSSPPAGSGSNSRDFSFGSLPHDQRETQSSPLAPSANNTNNTKLFKYASVPFRAGNPLTSKKRDEVRDTKRKLFLANVRQRQEDKKWERRGGEDEILKLEFYRLDKERKQRILQQLVVEPEEEEDNMMEVEDDAKMVGLLEEQEREELNTLLELEMERARQEVRVDGGEEERDDYDGLFMEIISSQEATISAGGEWDGQGDVEMS
ncbi:hypothetical protein QBC38DRAFT_471912 [Podospora fimiseda]|uniref:Uncharacterized protein n=1 Tax=Podospora fimiseda TaxID=252190 RepID=A0AAN7BU30_9PEZI|nr:hypothetical protein QBC38DRAFT_471912 [Podospora fimiseda]